MRFPFTVLDAKGNAIARASTKREAHQLALSEGGSWRREDVAGEDAPVERALSSDWRAVEVPADLLGPLFGHEPVRRFARSRRKSGLGARLPQIHISFRKPQEPSKPIPVTVSIEQLPPVPKREILPEPERAWETRRRERDAHGRASGVQAPVIKKPTEPQEDYEQRLLTASLAGNMTAYGQLFHERKRVLASFAKKYHKEQDATVDDVLQDVLLSTWNARDQLKNDLSEWQSWIFTAIQNRSLDLLRRAKLRRHDQVDDAPIPAEVAIERPTTQSTFGAVSPEHLVGRLQASRKVREKILDVIDGMGPQFKDVYELVYERNMKPTEAAEVLSEKWQRVVTPDYVSVRLHRLHGRLLETYGPEFWREALQTNPRGSRRGV